MCLLCFANSKQHASLDAIIPYANIINLLLYINISSKSVFKDCIVIISFLFIYFLFHLMFVFFGFRIITL